MEVVNNCVLEIVLMFVPIVRARVGVDNNGLTCALTAPIFGQTDRDKAAAVSSGLICDPTAPTYGPDRPDQGRIDRDRAAVDNNDLTCARPARSTRHSARSARAGWRWSAVAAWRSPSWPSPRSRYQHQQRHQSPPDVEQHLGQPGQQHSQQLGKCDWSPGHVQLDCK